jgi:hypothetical protein
MPAAGLSCPRRDWGGPMSGPRPALPWMEERRPWGDGRSSPPPRLAEEGSRAPAERPSR